VQVIPITVALYGHHGKQQKIHNSVEWLKSFERLSELGPAQAVTTVVAHSLRMSSTALTQRHDLGAPAIHA
jgi:DNA gyrase inhibitor GyrI